MTMGHMWRLSHIFASIINALRVRWEKGKYVTEVAARAKVGVLATLRERFAIKMKKKDKVLLFSYRQATFDMTDFASSRTSLPPKLL